MQHADKDRQTDTLTDFLPVLNEIVGVIARYLEPIATLKWDVEIAVTMGTALGTHILAVLAKH
jgi:hypothetical protein